jgi:cell division protein FtsW (lipid II flippase)
MPGIDRRLIQNFEWPLFTMTLMLAGIGIVNLISASPEQAAVGGVPGTALRQLAWLGIGVVLMFATLIPDYRSLERVALPFYALVVVLLV